MINDTVLLKMLESELLSTMVVGMVQLIASTVVSRARVSTTELMFFIN